MAFPTETYMPPAARAGVAGGARAVLAVVLALTGLAAFLSIATTWQGEYDPGAITPPVEAAAALAAASLLALLARDRLAGAAAGWLFLAAYVNGDAVPAPQALPPSLVIAVVLLLLALVVAARARRGDGGAVLLLVAGVLAGGAASVRPTLLLFALFLAGQLVTDWYLKARETYLAASFACLVLGLAGGFLAGRALEFEVVPVAGSSGVDVLAANQALLIAAAAAALMAASVGGDTRAVIEPALLAALALAEGSLHAGSGAFLPAIAALALLAGAGLARALDGYMHTLTSHGRGPAWAYALALLAAVLLLPPFPLWQPLRLLLRPH